MTRERMPVRILGRTCDECSHIEKEHPGTCPVKEFTAWVRGQADNQAYNIQEAYSDAEERGICGTEIFHNGPARQANLWCPHRIEDPEKEDVFLFQMRPER